MTAEKEQSASTDEQRLTSEEIAIVQDLDKNLGRLKIELANLTIQAEALNQQKLMLVQKATQVEGDLRAKLEELLKSKGLDPKSRWNFNFSAMRFEELPHA